MMALIVKPWGSEQILFSGSYVVKRLTMEEGHRCSLQFHRKKTETVYVLSGELELTIGPTAENLKTEILKSGDYVTIPPTTIHRMMGITHVVYLESSTNELDDVVRLHDDYSRLGT